MAGRVPAIHGQTMTDADVAALSAPLAPCWIRCTVDGGNKSRHDNVI